MTKPARYVTHAGLVMRVHSAAWRWWQLNKYRITGHGNPKHPGAGDPNPPHRHIKKTKPTVPAGHGLTGKRAVLHSLMAETLAHHTGWIYSFYRPLTLIKKGATVVHADCSFAVKLLFFWAGIRDDPTGENWTGWGNSSSTYQHLPKRPGLDNATAPTGKQLAACKVGDILLVGENGSEHMALIMEAGENPLLWSDGHQGAPDSYRILDDPRRPISVCIPKGLD